MEGLESFAKTNKRKGLWSLLTTPANFLLLSLQHYGEQTLKSVTIVLSCPVNVNLSKWYHGRMSPK